MHPRPLILASALLAAATGLQAPPARALPPGYDLQLVHDYLSFPSALRFAPDGRLFYLELLSGRVMTYPDSSPSAVASAWATVPVNGASERGLLGLAFHPDFPDSPFVYLYYSTADSPHVNRVVRMTDSAGVGTRHTVLLDSLPGEGGRHQGGRLAFGPDRMLYVTTGEQGDPALSGNVSSPMGKILRLGLTGGAAPGNPYGPGNPAFAIGVRNAFGICFDPLSGEGYFTDNGPECDDELNHLVPAVDYGWGYSDPCGGDPPGAMPPMWRATPPVAPTGCCIYRGGVYPGMEGNLFFGTFNNGTVQRVVLHPGSPGVADAVETFFESPGESVVDVTRGPDGRLWLASITRILRIIEPPVDTAVESDPRAGRWAAWPNPYTRAVAFTGPPGVTPREIDIVDPTGRRVRHWSAPSARQLWDGRDEDGREVPPGVYLIRFRTDAGSITRRLVRLSPR